MEAAFSLLSPCLHWTTAALIAKPAEQHRAAAATPTAAHLKVKLYVSRELYGVCRSRGRCLVESPSGKHNENDMHGKRLRRGSSYYAVLLVTAARERATALRKAAACGLVNTPQLHSLSDEPY